ncbi:MAG: proton-conducting transporter membrane subunit [Armatimonadota bacterium]|nr:proton-conducting transporter membrane subunit [Armatimonadota bacterium]MDR5696598.1 proton-conducting transporter membrane subunit [Armatimonadota bacterium]
MSTALLWVPLIPIVGAAFIAPLSRRAAAAGALGVCAVTLALLGALSRQALPVSAGAQWLPALGVRYALALDGLGSVFSLLIAGVGILIVAYAIGYLPKEARLGTFFAFLMLFMGSMLGLVLADDLIVLYVFWELTSVASFLLIGFHHEDPESRRSAIRALVVTVLGGLAMLAGIVLMGTTAGTFAVSALVGRADAVQASTVYPWIVGLLLAGAFTKSAQVPFHFWLPSAMVAPTPVSAYLHSATMVKAGVFLLLRLGPVLGGTQTWSAWVVPVGMATFLFAAAVAVFQDDLKALLAYATVSALGLATALAGTGTVAGRDAALLVLLTHAAYKGTLFLVAGAVEHETHSRSIRRLGGLARTMPITAVLSGAAAMSMLGIPGFGGFWAKEAASAALPTVEAALLSAGSVFTAAYGFRFLSIFWRPPDAEPGAHDAPTLLAPAAVLAATGVLFGLWPASLEQVVAPVAGTVNLWHGLKPDKLGLTILTLALGAALARWGSAPALPVEGGRIFDRWMDMLMAFAKFLARRTITGVLRDYLAAVLVTAIAGAGFALWRFGDWSGTDPFRPFPHEVMVVVLAIAAVVTATVVRSLVAVVIALGAVGYTVALLFLSLLAPDLALTQVLVETVTLVLFLTVVTHLLTPDEPNRHPGMAVDALLAVGAGLTAAGLASQILRRSEDTRLATFFAEHAQAAGGTNLVNLILVDFRGLDTLGEITVLGIAALGVFALAQRRRPR